MSELDTMTIDELGEIVNSWYEYQDQLSHERWEQTRTMCLYTLAPHSKAGLKPRDVFELSWDKPDKHKNQDDVRAKSTKADFDSLRQRWG